MRIWDDVDDADDEDGDEDGKQEDEDGDEGGDEENGDEDDDGGSDEDGDEDNVNADSDEDGDEDGDEEKLYRCLLTLKLPFVCHSYNDTCHLNYRAVRWHLHNRRPPRHIICYYFANEEWS